MTSLLDWLTNSQDFFRQLDWLGVLLFAAGVVVAQMAIAPLSPVAVASGLIFGFGRGWLAITLGTGVGAAVNFLIARYLARGVVARRLEKNEKFRLIDAAIGREGWKIVFMLRFVPMPFGLANYAYGLTAIRFWPYVGATCAAIVPANTFLVWVGTAAKTSMAAAAGAETPTMGRYIFLGIGLVATFCALIYVTKIARAAVARANG